MQQPSEQKNYIEYSVQKGDTLWGIAESHYHLKSDTKIAAAVNSIAEYNAKNNLSERVRNTITKDTVNSKGTGSDGVMGDLIYAGSSLLLPNTAASGNAVSRGSYAQSAAAAGETASSLTGISIPGVTAIINGYSQNRDSSSINTPDGTAVASESGSSSEASKNAIPAPIIKKEVPANTSSRNTGSRNTGMIRGLEGALAALAIGAFGAYVIGKKRKNKSGGNGGSDENYSETSDERERGNGAVKDFYSFDFSNLPEDTYVRVLFDVDNKKNIRGYMFGAYRKKEGEEFENKILGGPHDIEAIINEAEPVFDFTTGKVRAKQKSNDAAVKPNGKSSNESRDYGVEDIIMQSYLDSGIISARKEGRRIGLENVEDTLLGYNAHLRSTGKDSKLKVTKSLYRGANNTSLKAQYATAIIGEYASASTVKEAINNLSEKYGIDVSKSALYAVIDEAAEAAGSEKLRKSHYVIKESFQNDARNIVSALLWNYEAEEPVYTVQDGQADVQEESSENSSSQQGTSDGDSSGSSAEA
jgi:hypothetical protein